MRLTFDLQGTQLPHFVRTSLFTFLLLCVVVLAVLMLSLGLFFQIGTWLSPWLITNGWGLLKFTFTLLIVFRISIVLARLGRQLHRHGARNANYRTLLVILRGTFLYLWKMLTWALFQ